MADTLIDSGLTPALGPELGDTIFEAPAPSASSTKKT